MNARRLVVASHNLHKIREIKAMTAHLGWEVVGLPELANYPSVEEDGETLQENARKKAVTIASLVQELVLADDSGLEVDALGGAPGVYSSRFAGEPSDDQRNNGLLLAKLKSVPDDKRGAQFRCVMALASPQGWVKYSEGVCRGVIIHEPQGVQGFGYDPLFLVPEYGLTFAQLEPKVKNQISHRYLAMQGTLEILKTLEL